MGEVYRARDTKLESRRRDQGPARPRSPTIPIGSRGSSAKRRLLASLNHPHIAHDLRLRRDPPDGEQATPALVMELVEGADLADRIAPAPMPLDEALPIARQIAEALEAAHERGDHPSRPEAGEHQGDRGRHREGARLRPGQGARPDAASASAGRRGNSPTLTIAATTAGHDLGTAAYMAPEQARGKPVDKRADIWAFGVVLYEMLTGRRPFEGDTVSDTIAAVLRGEIDWARLPRRHAGRAAPAAATLSRTRARRTGCRMRRTPGVIFAELERDVRVRLPARGERRQHGGSSAAVAAALLAVAAVVSWTVPSASLARDARSRPRRSLCH